MPTNSSSIPRSDLHPELPQRRSTTYQRFLVAHDVRRKETKLIARGLIGHLGRGRTEAANVIEKLAELGIKTMITIDGKSRR
jgi:hypothetical protein